MSYQSICHTTHYRKHNRTLCSALNCAFNRVLYRVLYCRLGEIWFLRAGQPGKIAGPTEFLSARGVF